MRSIVTIILLLNICVSYSQENVIGFVHLHISSNFAEFSDNNFGYTYKNGEAIRKSHDQETIEIDFIENLNDTNSLKRKLLFEFDSVVIQNKCIVDNSWINIQCINQDSLYHGIFYYYFKCIQKLNGYYQIIINEDTGETAWINQSNYTNFISFDIDISKKSFFRKFKLENNSETTVYEKPSFESPSNAINAINLGCYQILKRKGDWVKVKINKNTSCYNPFSIPGWIKLFDNERLLLEIKCR